MGARLKDVYTTVRTAWKEVKQNNILDWAAALTYYGMLSLFPGLIVLVSLIGLVGESATGTLLDQMQGFAPGPARDIFESAITGIERSSTSSGVFFVIGLATAIWSASGYVGAFGRASGSIWSEHDERPGWQAIVVRVLTTVVLLVLLSLIGMMLVFSGPLTSQLSKLLGVGDQVVTIWNWIKWPLLPVLFMLLLSLLYHATPGDDQAHRHRVVSYGSAIAIAIWVVASLGFTLYVSEFSSYSKVYGSLAGVVVFLIWLWITNVAILLGVHIDAMRAGAPAESEL